MQAEKADHLRHQPDPRGYSDPWAAETTAFCAHGLTVYEAALFDDDEGAHLARLNELIKPRSVLVDMGTGCGTVPAALMAMNPGLLAYGVTNCAEQLRRLCPGVIPVAADFHATGLPDGIADTVTFLESFGYGNAPQLLAEAARLLRPGGELFVKDARAQLGKSRDADWGYTIYCLDTWADMLDAAGLHSMQTTEIPVTNAAYLRFWHESATMRRLHPTVNPSGPSLVLRATKGAPRAHV